MIQRLSLRWPSPCRPREQVSNRLASQCFEKFLVPAVRKQSSQGLASREGWRVERQWRAGLSYVWQVSYDRRKQVEAAMNYHRDNQGYYEHPCVSALLPKSNPKPCQCGGYVGGGESQQCSSQEKRQGEGVTETPES